MARSYLRLKPSSMSRRKNIGKIRIRIRYDETSDIDPCCIASQVPVPVPGNHRRTMALRTRSLTNSISSHLNQTYTRPIATVSHQQHTTTVTPRSIPAFLPAYPYQNHTYSTPNHWPQPNAQGLDRYTQPTSDKERTAPDRRDSPVRSRRTDRYFVLPG
ncbi:hypothetical protein BDW69DRAFT_167320 [Aspergillus filifer]